MLSFSSWVLSLPYAVLIFGCRTCLLVKCVVSHPLWRYCWLGESVGDTLCGSLSLSLSFYLCFCEYVLVSFSLSLSHFLSVSDSLCLSVCLTLLFTQKVLSENRISFNHFFLNDCPLMKCHSYVKLESSNHLQKIWAHSPAIWSKTHILTSLFYKNSSGSGVLKAFFVTLGELLNFAGLRFAPLKTRYGIRRFLSPILALMDFRLSKPRIELKQSIFLEK